MQILIRLRQHFGEIMYTFYLVNNNKAPVGQISELNKIVLT